MLVVSSEYKNDLVCTQQAVSLTSFNFTARVGFITVLLSKYVYVSACERKCVCARVHEWGGGGYKEKIESANECFCGHTFWLFSCLLSLQHATSVHTCAETLFRLCEM